MGVLSYTYMYAIQEHKVKCIESNCNPDLARPKSSPASSQFGLEGV